MNPYYPTCIGLGSNLGDSRKLLQDAWTALGNHQDISLQVLSLPYRTRPTEMDTPHWFINAAGLLHTSLPPESLLDVLLNMEQQFGRVRSPEKKGYQDRTLDLDLLLYDDQILKTERVILPHPMMHQRMFVLAPLAEIVPNLEHPLLHKTISRLWTELGPKTDREDVEQVCWQNTDYA